MTGKVLAIGGILVFFGFAALQINDPDPVGWIAFYGGAGLICAFSLTSYFRWPAAGGFAAGALVAAVVHAVRYVPHGELWGKGSPGWEMGGLVVTGVWMGFLAIQARRATVSEGEQEG